MSRSESRPRPRGSALALAAALLFALATLVPAGWADPSAPDGDPALGRALDRAVAPLVGSGDLTGQLVVARGRQVLVERSWGLADREHRTPMTPTTRMCIASITKPITQIVAIGMMTEGALAASDTIGRWLAGFPHGGRITVQQLMRHEAGIPHRVTTDLEEREPLTAADITRRVGRAPLMFEPGTSASYSSAGYTVLARVLEVAAGHGWGDLVRERVFRPASMTHSVPSAGRRDRLPERAASYLPGSNGAEPAPPKDLGFLAGAGSVWSTARDLHALAVTLVEGGYGDEARRGLVRGGRLRWSGSTNGFRSFVDYDSATGLVVAYLGNHHTGGVDLLRLALPRLLTGAPVEPLVSPGVATAPVADEVLRRYEGRYDVAGNPRLAVRAREGRLWAEEWMLVPTSDTTFFSPRDYARVTAGRDSLGRWDHLDWIVGGQTFRCPRVGDLGPPETSR